MELRGTWDESTVLITSDHGWRLANSHGYPRLRKIPFVLKMPGQRNNLDYTSDFAPMRLTKSLLLEIQRGTIKDSVGVAEWINKRRPNAR